MSDVICPLCDRACKGIVELVGEPSQAQYYEVICKSYGAAAISEKAIERIKDDKSKWSRFLNLLKEKHLKDFVAINGKEFFYEQESLDTLLRSRMVLIIEDGEDVFNPHNYPVKILDQFLKEYPATLTEKLDRALCNLARASMAYYNHERFIPTVSYLFAKDFAEAKYFCGLLVESGWCQQEERFRSQATSHELAPITITLNGWRRFEELNRGQNSTTAFIAMWFNREHMEKYRKATENAISQAGYNPVIIDSFNHNNFIMDEVINQINEAKFVIADFTCIPEQPEESSKIPGGVRGGVYFEAGYAKGLGKEVIVTCKNDDASEKRRHFDIDQLNTLFWDEKDDGKLYDTDGRDFVHRLTERIKATVGKGPFFVEEKHEQ